MRNHLKSAMIGAAGVVVGVGATLIVVLIVSVAPEFFGPPRVTLMNATGEDISEVTISLGAARRELPALQDGFAVTVPILGRFSECSTQVAWTDSAGRHDESAEDYMENDAFYHARVVLTPEGKAKAICEAREPE